MALVILRGDNGEVIEPDTEMLLRNGNKVTLRKAVRTGPHGGIVLIESLTLRREVFGAEIGVRVEDRP